MSIKARILISLMVTAVITATAILVANAVQFSNYINASFDNELQKMQSVIFNEIDRLKSKAHIASLYFSNDTAIAKAMESGNRQEILDRATWLYEEADVELCTVTDSSGMVVARTHSPENFGDNLSSMYYTQAALSGNYFSTIEYTVYEDMMACSSAPVYSEQGLLLGVIIVGFRLDTEEFVDGLKKLTNYEISIFRKDVRVATTLIDEDGIRPVGTILAGGISAVVLAGKIYNNRMKVLNRDMLTVFAPIKNHQNLPIGMLFVGYYLQEKTDTIRSFITAGAFITLFFLGISVIFTFFFAEYLSSPIIKMIDKIHYDALTGIHNRRFFDENLERLIKTLSRSGGMLSLMMIDIDFFKNYNDTYGHSEGDTCLKAVTKVLTEGATRADDFVARYGGEEFTLVLPNTDENGARSIAQRLLGSMRACNIPHKRSSAADHVTISIGVTSGRVNHTQNGSDYIKRADEALYKSKQGGRDRYNFAPL